MIIVARLRIPTQNQKMSHWMRWLVFLRKASESDGQQNRQSGCAGHPRLGCFADLTLSVILCKCELEFHTIHRFLLPRPIIRKSSILSGL